QGGVSGGDGGVHGGLPGKHSHASRATVSSLPCSVPPAPEAQPTAPAGRTPPRARPSPPATSHSAPGAWARTRRTPVPTSSPRHLWRTRKPTSQDQRNRASRLHRYDNKTSQRSGARTGGAAYRLPADVPAFAGHRVEQALALKVVQDTAQRGTRDVQLRRPGQFRRQPGVRALKRAGRRHLLAYLRFDALGDSHESAPSGAGAHTTVTGRIASHTSRLASYALSSTSRVWWRAHCMYGLRLRAGFSAICHARSALSRRIVPGGSSAAVSMSW